LSNDAYKKIQIPIKSPWALVSFKDNKATAPIFKSRKTSRKRLLAEKKTKSFISVFGKAHQLIDPSVQRFYL